MTRLTNNIQAGDVSYHRGPSLGALGVVFVSLFALSLVVTGAMTGGARFPTPYEPVASAQDYFSRYADVIRIAAFLQFGAAIPLGTHPARHGHRSGRVTRPSTARVRDGRTGARRNAGTSPGRGVRAFGVCETHPALARVARANRCGDC